MQHMKNDMSFVDKAVEGKESAMQDGKVSVVRTEKTPNRQKRCGNCNRSGHSSHSHTISQVTNRPKKPAGPADFRPSSQQA